VVRAPVLLPSGLHSCTTTFYYFSVDVHGTALLPFFLHQLMIDYFKQLNMSTVVNRTAGSSGTSPASRYNLMLLCLFVIFVLFLYRLSMNMNNLYAAIILLILNNNMIYLMDFGIKIYHKMPKILTIQKLDCYDSFRSLVLLLRLSQMLLTDQITNGGMIE
jgi:hypothetical protein